MPDSSGGDPQAIEQFQLVDESSDPIDRCESESGERCSDKGFLAMAMAMAIEDYLELDVDGTLAQSRLSLATRKNALSLCFRCPSVFVPLFSLCSPVPLFSPYRRDVATTVAIIPRENATTFSGRRVRCFSVSAGRFSDPVCRGYLSVKSRNHQPSSHSRLTFRHPNGTCG